MYLGFVAAALSMVLCASCFLVSATASATVLCKTATKPCSGGSYEAGTVIKAALSSEKAVFIPMGVCKASEFAMEVTNAGGEATDVSGTVSLSFSNCSCSGSVVGKGNFSISYVEGGDAVLKLNNFEMKTPYAFNCMGEGCVYGTTVASGITVQSGATAGIKAKEAKFPKISGPLGCGSYAFWEGSYTVTTPKPLYVEPS